MLKFITIQYDSQMSLPGGSPIKQAKLLINSSLAYFFSQNRLQIVCKIKIYVNILSTP